MAVGLSNWLVVALEWHNLRRSKTREAGQHMGQSIDVLARADGVLPAVNRSALLAMAAGGRVNATTISWGMLGVEWAKPVFITFVCKGRFSRTPAGQDGRVCHWHPRRGLRPHDSGACGQRVWERRRQDQGAGAACGGSTDCLGARHIRGINYAGMLRCASSTAGS